MPRKSPSILILDSHRELAEAYKKRLMLEGFDCKVFDAHDEALEYISTLPCDLLIVDDHNMKEVSISDFLELINAQMHFKTMPILVLSSSGRDQQIDGIDAYILKTATGAGAVIEKVKSLINSI